DLPLTLFVSIRSPATSLLFPYTTLFRSEQERWQIGGDVRERQDRRVEFDSQHVGHERPPLLDPVPGPRVAPGELLPELLVGQGEDRKSTRLNSSHVKISYAVFCLKKKKL